MASGIVFLCGSLEPGRDGVGDYTRRLAGILQRAGNRVQLIALYDKQAEHVHSEVQREQSSELTVLRIPYATPVTERLSQLQTAIDACDPAWISLQYVPHGYNKYGLPLGLLYVLTRLRTQAARHIMFHELWITPRRALDPKEQLITTVERQAVRWLLGPGFRPQVVHTHLPTYRDRLVERGATVRPLPLFANIGRTSDSLTHREPGVFTAAFFSQLTAPAPVVEFLRQLRQHLTQRGVQLEVSLLGGGPEKVARAAAELREALPGLTIHPVGFLAAAHISEQLSRADLGITPVQQHEIGKSGTVAAFLTHRLPVAAPVVTESTPSFFLPELNGAILSQFSAEGLARAQDAAAALDTELISAPRIAETLAADLTAARPTSPIFASTAPATLPE